MPYPWAFSELMLVHKPSLRHAYYQTGIERLFLALPWWLLKKKTLFIVRYCNISFFSSSKSCAYKIFVWLNNILWFNICCATDIKFSYIHDLCNMAHICRINVLTLTTINSCLWYREVFCELLSTTVQKVSSLTPYNNPTLRSMENKLKTTLSLLSRIVSYQKRGHFQK